MHRLAIVCLALAILTTVLSCQERQSVEVARPDSLMFETADEAEIRRESARERRTLPDSATTIAPDFTGVEPMKAYSSLRALSYKASKGEFETSAEAAARFASELTKPVIYDLTIDDLIPVVLTGTEFEYDADMSAFKIDVPSAFASVSFAKDYGHLGYPPPIVPFGDVAPILLLSGSYTDSDGIDQIAIPITSTDLETPVTYEIGVRADGYVTKSKTMRKILLTGFELPMDVSTAKHRKSHLRLLVALKAFSVEEHFVGRPTFVEFSVDRNGGIATRWIFAQISHFLVFDSSTGEILLRSRPMHRG